MKTGLNCNSECDGKSYKVSICMIVKDDPANLERCIDSLLPIIYHKNDETGKRECELVIVDTGSSDITPNIARKHADKFYVKKWVKWDFSRARNYGIKRASGEKIFVMDADEVLPQECVYGLKYILFSDKVNDPTIFLKIKNYQKKDGSQFTTMMQPRIFKNDCKAIYECSVHNKPRTETPYYFANKITIDHWGYMFEGRPKLQQKKNDRSVPMLMKEIKKDPDNLHAITHLVKHYQTMGQIDEMQKLAERWIELMQKVEFHVGWTSYLEVFVTLVNSYIVKNDTQNMERVKTIAERFSQRLMNMYFIIGEHYSMLKQDEVARVYMEHGLTLAQKPLDPYEMLLTQNTEIIIPKYMNWLACYYFRKGDYDKAGQFVNDGIHSNKSRLPLRWDVFNEDQSRKRLIVEDSNAA